MKQPVRHILVLLSACLCLQGCSTTKCLSEGQYRLDDVDVVVTDPDGSFQKSSVQQFIRQKPNSSFLGLNPLVSMYNWGGKFFTKIGEEPVVYSASSTESSRMAMQRHLAYLGYYDAQVEGKATTSGKLTKVRYEITLGERLHIDSVLFDIPKGGEFEEEFMADLPNVTLRPGTVLSESLLDAESNRAAAHLRTMGFFGFGKSAFLYEADTVSVPGKTFLTYRIVPIGADGQIHRFHVGDVSITCPESFKFKDNVLKDLCLVKPGELYNEKTVNSTYSRFSAVRALGNVAVEMNQSSKDEVDCEIRIKPGTQQGFKANLEASTNSSGLIGVSPRLTFFHSNFLRGGETLNLGFTGNFQFKPNSDTRADEFGVSAGLVIPRFIPFANSKFKGPMVPSTEIGLSYNIQDRPEYARRVFTGTYGYSGRTGHGLYFSVTPVRLSLVSMSRLDEQFDKRLERNPYMKYSYQDHFDAGVGGMLLYNTSSEVIPKDAYSSAQIQFDMSGLVLSAFNGIMEHNNIGQHLILGTPYSQYARFELSIVNCVRFGRNDSNALAFRVLGGLGFAYGNSTALPYEKQFYAGGASGMRGWQARALGPGFDPLDNTFSIPSQTGDMKIEVDLEWRFPIAGKLEGAMFAEAGNVWNKTENVDVIKSVAADWGLGLRINLDFILMRLDWGIRLRDPSLPEGSMWLTPWQAVSSGGSAIHFGVGYPF